MILQFYIGLVGTPPLQMVDDIMGIQKCSNKSLRLNKAINTFIDLEKLTLSKKKCHNVHIGKQNVSCKALTIDGSKMENSNQESGILETPLTKVAVSDQMLKKENLKHMA